MRSSAQTAFAARHPLQRQRQRLDDEIVDRKPVDRLAVLSFGARIVRLLAHLQQRIHADVGGEIEMRDGLLRLRQPAAMVARMPSSGTSSDGTPR